MVHHLRTNRAPFVAAIALCSVLAAVPGAAYGFAGQPKHEKRDEKRAVEALEEKWRTAQLAGDVAIVTSVADVEGTSEGASVQGKYRYTRVYQHLPSGEWKITSFEATRISPPRSERSNQPKGTQPSGGGEPTSEPRCG